MQDALTSPSPMTRFSRQGLVKFVQMLARDKPLTCNFCFWSCKRAPLESSRSCPTKPWRNRDVARVFVKLSRIMTWTCNKPCRRSNVR